MDFAQASQVVSLCVGVCGAMIGISGWRRAQRTAAKEFWQDENAPRLRDARRELRQGGYDFEKTPEAFCIVVDHYHYWGFMARCGYIPLSVFDGEPGASLLEYFDRMCGRIAHWRLVGKPLYAEEFAWLAWAVTVRGRVGRVDGGLYGATAPRARRVSFPFRRALSSVSVRYAGSRSEGAIADRAGMARGHPRHLHRPTASKTTVPPAT